MAKPRTKVLHIFGRMDRGGAELRTLDVMRHLDRTQFKLEFCVLSGQAGELDEEIRSLGGDVHYCRLGLGFGRRFRRILREVRPDVIHSHVFYTSGYLLRMAERVGVRIRIAHFRSTGDGNHRSARRHVQSRLLRHLIDKHATNILAVNFASMMDAWTRYMGEDERCEVVYNGIDLPAHSPEATGSSIRDELGLCAESRLVLNVGKFSPEKNVGKAITVFHELTQSDGKAVLALVGPGGNSVEDAMRELVASLNLSGRVRFLGIRTDVPKLMLESDVLLFPSLREGLPGVVLEACAAGTPVVASDLPGIVEISHHLDLVECLSESETDQLWAERVLNALNTPLDRTAAMTRFTASPFTIQNCASRFACIWQGH